jgi:hypothetical protein
MAITQTVYSPQYPNNAKTITVDIVSRVPVGAEGDEKYIVYVYTNAYSNNTDRTAINPVYMYEMKRGWAQSYIVNSPIVTSGGTLTVAIDEADSGAVTLTIASGTWSGNTLATSIQAQLSATASGVKATATNKLSYQSAQAKFEDSRITILSGSTRSSYNSSTWSDVSSVKVTGGTASSALGFNTGYPNSFDMATTSSGYLHGPSSAHVSVDDAIRYAVMYIANQIDYTS